MEVDDNGRSTLQDTEDDVSFNGHLFLVLELPSTSVCVNGCTLWALLCTLCTYTSPLLSTAVMQVYTALGESPTV